MTSVARAGCAAAVFILCSIVQGAAGSTMFSTRYVPTDNLLMDLALNLTFWPGWLITVTLVVSAVRAHLAGESPRPVREEAFGDAVTSIPREAPPVRQWFIPSIISMVIVLMLSVGSWLWVRESPSNEGLAFAEEAVDPDAWTNGGAPPETEPEVPSMMETATSTSSPDEATTVDDLEGGCAPDDAQYTLESRRQQTLGALDLDGRWVLQLDSKYDGVVDPLQSAPDGGHTFSLSDICVLQSATAAEWEQAADVLHLKATDFGRQQSAHSDDIWLILIDPGADSIAPLGGGQVTDEDAQGACAQLLPDLSGVELANACVPRQLTPPSP